MISSGQRRLLTTRFTIAVAIGVTGLILALAVRGIFANRAKTEWPISPLFGLHGWPVIALNAVFYGYLCWLAFSFIRGTVGRERVFMIGWFAEILPSPLRMLGPEWVEMARYVGTFGLAVALLAALALLLKRPDAANSHGTAGTT
ncbi:MAG: hypothetical protein WBV46_03295 [Terriglobales bacterium]